MKRFKKRIVVQEINGGEYNNRIEVKSRTFKQINAYSFRAGGAEITLTEDIIRIE